jgi:primosomal protein N' (replication factor Y) (superfamily II helicase)
VTRVPQRFLKVAVFAPLRALFDYHCPSPRAPRGLVGCRVLVPFGRGTRVGVVVAVTASSTILSTKVKDVLEILDDAPLIERALIDLATWAVDYYHCPPGEVFEALLATELRHGKPLREVQIATWEITDAGRTALTTGTALGPRQREMLGLVAQHPHSRDQLLAAGLTTLRVASDCVRRGWLRTALAVEVAATPAIHEERFLNLNAEQAAAIGILRAGRGYRTCVLHGITGSGKTEIYLHLVRDVLQKTGQALVLIPEIGLTEQLVKRFEERFGAAVAVIHSGLSERARATVWQRCRAQKIRVLVGTRSAVWMPLPNLQLIVVDEEHDASYKQQEGIRYSARDLAVVRAHRQGILIVLGSATPSLESLANCARGKYQYVEILSRARGAKLPQIQVLDVRGLQLEAGISEPLQRAVRECAARGEQSLLFLNRRGFAPIVLCHHCGWIASCPRCDARLVLHQEQQRLRCHHCGTERKINAAFPEHPCGELTEYASLGVGTEQLERAFPKLFPGLRAIRIDRDSIRRKGQLEEAFTKVSAGEVDILVGTQMIAKGHDFSNVTLVGIVDGDSGLLATDFRAEERFVQLVLQVAGRAGRGERPGVVLIQSHHPQHSVFNFLCRGSYRDFAQHALQERAAAELPPHTSLVLLRAEATERTLPLRFLNQLATALKRTLPAAVSIGGPVPALMERRIGKFRANLLLTAEDRAVLADAIRQLLAHIERMPLANKLRWSLDVDAHEIA